VASLIRWRDRPPILCWVLDGAALARCGEAGLRAACDAGVDWIQVRDRALEGAELLAAVDCAVAAARASARRVRVIVNRRVDIAWAAGADGVHLGFDALPAARVRALLGRDAWIGISLHDPDEIAGESAASYAHLAPIFAPLSKPAERPPLGLAALRVACGRRGVLVLAQGGIEVANAAAAVAAGAAGVAVTGAISGADDSTRAASLLRSALDG
jgi:thiamine-phosphate pyrophosphorylase